MGDLLVLICHPQHPFADIKNSSSSTLSGQKFIGFGAGTPLPALDRILKDNDVQVQHVMEFDNIETG